MLLKAKIIFDRFLEILVMSVVAFLTIDVLIQVVTREASKQKFLVSFAESHKWFAPVVRPTVWTEELAIFLLIWVALLGAAVALNRGAHLGIDYFVGKLDKKTKIYTEIFAFFCVACFAFFVMILGGIDLVQTTLYLKQRATTLDIHMGYVYLAVPISGGFMLLYSVLAFVERLVLCIQHPEKIETFQSQQELPEEID
jgi:TRAP-type C4-dicarboxylate transport system permease small subunit